MTLPKFAVAFLRDALAPGIREAGLFVARKNAKSAAIAVLILSCLSGPLRRPGWQCGVVSVNREKTNEIRKQIEAIASASQIEGLTFRRSPAPGHVESAWGRVDFLSADKSAGHASGFDLALVDELGLLPERKRDLVAGMLSSVSARDGRMLSISILGDSPFTRELIERRDDPAVVVHLHQAPEGCALDDKAAWKAANPTLGTIKARAYMRDTSRKAKNSPADAPAFRAFDLNQPQAPSRSMIVDLAEYREKCGGDQPERLGPVSVGFDLGGSRSLCAACAYWIETGRAELWAAVPGKPTLRDRGEADGVGRRYEHLHARGELSHFPDALTTPVGPFLARVADDLAGEDVVAAAADRYRKSEAEQALLEAEVDWPMTWRASGAGRDGSADIRAFQKAIYRGEFRPGESLLLECAISDSALRHDLNGNPALDKAHAKGRIDALSAAVLAVGIAPQTRPATIIHQPFSERRYDYA